MKITIIIILSTITFTLNAQVYKNPKALVEDRVRDLLAHMAQLYIHDIISPVERPLKELKGFTKVFLKRGETKEFKITLDEAAFSYYKTALKDFGYDPGEFEILVGSSSKDIRIKKTISLK